MTRIWAAAIVCPLPESGTLDPRSALLPKEMRRRRAGVPNSFLVTVSIWFGINILFVAVRLWVTRLKNWQTDACFRQFSTVCVKSRLRRHV
jgi:hypothetical protein